MPHHQTLLARQQARRLRFVTSQLTWGFPGMTRSPLGVIYLLPPSVWLGVPLGWGTFLILSIALVLGSIAAYLLLGDYYKRRFGRVLPRVEPSRPLAGLLPFLILVAAFGFSIFAYFRQIELYGFGLFLGLYYLITWLRSDGLRLHRGIAAAFTLAVSLLPLWRLFTVREVVEIVEVIFALELLLGGICDHFLLVRSFRELAKGIHEHAIPRAC